MQTDAEIEKLFGVVVPDQQGPARRRRLSGGDAQCQVSPQSIPAAFDWRQYDKVTPVKQQGECGSCYTFATSAAIESAVLIKRGLSASQTNFDLSEQRLVNCVNQVAGRQNDGCHGGFAEDAFNYAKTRGMK